MTVDNSTGAVVRADINSALQALATNNSGSSAPSTTFATQFFADTNEGIMKLRNTSNNGYVNLFTLAGGVDVDAASNFNEDVTFTGASANIVFDKSDNQLEFADNAKAEFGTGGDLEIYHDGSNSILFNNTGQLALRGNEIRLTAKNTENYFVGTLDGAVELYFDNSKKFETFANGVQAANNGNIKLASDTGKFFMGAGDDAELFHDGTNLTLNGDGTNATLLRAKSGENSIKLIPDGAVELYFDNAKKAETVTGGFTVTGTCTATAFAGDGSALTGISGSGTTINNNADNRVITGSGTANTLNAESDFIVNSSNNIGIGNDASFPVYTHVNSRNFMLGHGGESTALQIHSANNLYGGIYFGDVADSSDANSIIGSIEYKHGDDFMNFRTNGSERLKINSSGGFEHTSVDNTAYKVSIAGAVRFQVVHSGGGNMVLSNPSSGNVTYSTSSDYRLKENATTINNALTTVKSLKPYQFTWKHDSTIGQGFFAHEVLETTPNSQAALGTKDEVETVYYQANDTIPEGKAIGDVKDTASPVYQQVDYSKLVPLLTAALQESIAKIEVLETKVAALEAA